MEKNYLFIIILTFQPFRLLSICQHVTGPIKFNIIHAF
jgi:hypothetical protein